MEFCVYLKCEIFIFMYFIEANVSREEVLLHHSILFGVVENKARHNI